MVGFIAVVKKTFRYSDVFLLQPLIPAFYVSEHISGKWYNVGQAFQSAVFELSLPDSFGQSSSNGSRIASLSLLVRDDG